MNKIKINKKNIIIWLIGAVLSFSASMLAFYEIIQEHYTKFNVILTIITAFIVFYYFYVKTAKDTWKYIKNNIIICDSIFLMALVIVIKLYSAKSVNTEKFFIFDSTAIKGYIFSAFSLSWLGIWLYKKAADFLKDIYKELDKTDKKNYFYISIIASIIVIAAYSFNTRWFTQYDSVYSIDSGYAFSSIFKNASYYDIRHPLLSIFTFPIYALIEFFSEIFVPKNIQTAFCAVCLQLINIQLLLLGGILLKILTKSKTVFILYVLSFSTILYTLFFEKYLMCIFPVILYVYMLDKNHKKSAASLIIGGGFMATSFLCAFMELFTGESIKNKFKKFFKIACSGILTIICFGRGHMLTEGLTEVVRMRGHFGSGSYSISERLISLTKMFQGSLIPLSSNAENRYIWTSVVENLTIPAVFILILIIIGIVSNRKKNFIKFCTIQLLISFLIFVCFKWSPHESPLFSIYFSWAIIPILKEGIDCLLVKILGISEKVVYGVLIPIMFIINTLAIIDISIFLKGL